MAVVKTFTIPIDTQLAIPDIGDKIELTESWTFRLFDEYRNNEFKDNCKAHGMYDDSNIDKGVDYLLTKYPLLQAEAKHIKSYFADGYLTRVFNRHLSGNDLIECSNEDLYEYMPKVTLPIGSVIYVDRVYIKKGMSDYSSITFRIENFPAKKKSSRFWVKLYDTRNIKGSLSHLIR